MDYTLFSDDHLAQLAASGDAGAFETLVRAYSRPIFNFAYRFLADCDLASEVAQDTFIRLHGMLSGQKTDHQVRPLIYRIARNRCIDLLRERKAIVFSALAADPDGEESPIEGLADPSPLPAELAERHDLQQLLREAIVALPPRYRQVVALRYTTDLTFAEIAAALELPESTAKTLFQRAKPMLREALRDRI